MRHLKVIVCAVLSIGSYAQSWMQISNFPGTARDDGASFTINNKSYCFSGLSSVGCERDGYAFNCSNETWDSIASLPNAQQRQYAAGFSYNGKGYMFGGVNCSNVYLNDLWRFDTLANSWTQLTSLPAAGRHGAHAFVIGSKAYIAGGWDNTNFLNELWQFDPATSQWSQKNNLPVSGFWRGASFVINDTAYIAFGFTNNNNFNHSIYRYNTNNDSWQQLNSSLPSRKYGGCAVVNNRAYFYGGQDSLNVVTNDLLVFDPLSANVSTLSGIPALARKGGMCFSNNNNFYFTTGLNSAGQRTNETWRLTTLVGAHENSLMEFTLAPNPASDYITFNSKTPEVIQFMLRDISGQTVTSCAITLPATISLSEYNPGVYFVTLKNVRGSVTKKLLIYH